MRYTKKLGLLLIKEVAPFKRENKRGKSNMTSI